MPLPPAAVATATTSALQQQHENFPHPTTSSLVHTGSSELQPLQPPLDTPAPGQQQPPGGAGAGAGGEQGDWAAPPPPLPPQQQQQQVVQQQQQQQVAQQQQQQQAPSLSAWELRDLPALLCALRRWLWESAYPDEVPFTLKDPHYLLEQLGEALAQAQVVVVWGGHWHRWGSSHRA